MSDSLARRLAIAGWISTVIATAAALWIRTAIGIPVLPNRFGMGDLAMAGIGLLQLTSASVAAVILVRLPRNRIGWLLLLTGASYAVSIVAALVATAATTGQPNPGQAEWGAWVAFVTSTISGIAFVSIAFLFPDGSPISPRWRRATVLGAVIAAIGLTAIAVQAGPNFLIPGLRNALRIGPDLSGLLGPASFGSFALGTGVLAGFVAFAVTDRFRRSRGVERLQLKWFVAATLTSMASLAVTGSVGFLATGSSTSEWPLVAFAVSGTTVPIAIGFAILRYRLYDIDRLVNRAIVYGSLTAILAGVFAAAARLAQSVMVALTGQSSDAAIVLTTLGVATLYAPLRARLERFVERHFKYEHARFGSYLADVNQVLSLADPRRAAERLATEAVREMDAIGGAVVDPSDVPTATAGEWPVPAVMRLPIPGGHGPLEAILLGRRRDGDAHDPRAIADLEDVARLVATAVWLHADPHHQAQPLDREPQIGLDSAKGT